MKNRIHVLILLVALPCVTMAEWSAPQVRHWAHLNGITADTSGVDVSSDDGIVGGWNIAWGAHPTLAQVEALDYATALDWTRATDEAQSTLDAELGQEMLSAELQQLSASLDALVFLELGEHINGTDEQLTRLSAVVVSSLESNRIEYSKAETLTELQTAGAHINNLRSIISLQAKIVSLR